MQITGTVIVRINGVEYGAPGEPPRPRPPRRLAVLQRTIVAYGKRLVMACDGRCDKAWGINTRLRTSLSDDIDDYVYVADDLLGEAPADPGTYEGWTMEGKPSATPLTDPADAAKMNRWCFRECERSGEAPEGEPVDLPDMSYPEPNMDHRRLRA
jgi:hypothetical protein